MKTIQEHAVAEHVTRVQGHKVKYSHRSNSAADCMISLKFYGTGDTVEMLRSKVKGQGDSVK